MKVVNMECWSRKGKLHRSIGNGPRNTLTQGRGKPQAVYHNLCKSCFHTLRGPGGPGPGCGKPQRDAVYHNSGPVHPTPGPEREGHHTKNRKVKGAGKQTKIPNRAPCEIRIIKYNGPTPLRLKPIKNDPSDQVSTVPATAGSL